MSPTSSCSTGVILVKVTRSGPLDLIRSVMFQYLASSGEMRSCFHWVAHLGRSISNLFGETESSDKFNRERTYWVTFQQYDVMVILTLPLRLVVVAPLALAKVESTLEALGGRILLRLGSFSRVRAFVLHSSFMVVSKHCVGEVA